MLCNFVAKDGTRGLRELQWDHEALVVVSSWPFEFGVLFCCSQKRWCSWGFLVLLIVDPQRQTCPSTPQLTAQNLNLYICAISSILSWRRRLPITKRHGYDALDEIVERMCEPSFALFGTLWRLRHEQPPPSFAVN